MNGNGYQRQRGMGSLVFVIVILFFVGVGTVTLKMWSPVYDNYVITGIMQEVLDEPNTKMLPSSQIRSRIGMRLRVSGIRDFDLKQLKISRDKGVVTIKLAYEVERQLIRNFYLLAKFDEEVSSE